MGDDTTQVADGGETTETTEATEQTATVDKNSAQYRIQQLVEEKKALQAQLDEANQLSAKQKLEVESNYARQMYGESVDEPSVQEYKTKYPDLTYPQIFGALGIEVPTTHGSTRTPSRPVGTLSNSEELTYTYAQLEKMRNDNPALYNSTMDSIVAKKAKLVK